MSIGGNMYKIQLGPYVFIVLKQVGNRMLLSWTDSYGIQNERWVINKPVKAA